MSEERTTKDRGSHAAADGNGALSPDQRQSAVQALGRMLSEQLQSRIPTADLDERDPDYIRETLPGLWLLASFYFRADVKGLEKIPAEGPVLLVGNHSGGNVTPDTLVFSLAFATYFGIERRFFQLAHNLVLAMPGLGTLRKYGTVRRRTRTRARRSRRGPRCSSIRAATTRCTARRGIRPRSTS